MKPTPSRSVAALILATLAAAVLSTGCAKPPKPDELKLIEASFQNPETRKLKTLDGASKAYRDAYNLRLQAQDAYNSGDVEGAREYAIWSQLRLRAAEAVAEQFKAKQRFDEINGGVVKVNERLKLINQERNKLVTEVGTLEREVAVAQRIKDDEARRIAAQANMKVGSMEDDREKLAAIDRRIKQVEAARDRALGVAADKHAAATFAKANNQLKSIQVMRRNTPVAFDMIEEIATNAITLFGTSIQEAKPGYKVAVAKADPAARRASLLSDAQSAFGSSGAMLEGASVRVVASNIFASGSDRFLTTPSAQVEKLAKLATSYDEFTIRLEGFTSANGSATDNLATSQVRARRVRDALIAAGIKKDRITDDVGHGQGRARFSPPEDGRNDRVEVIFTR